MQTMQTTMQHEYDFFGRINTLKADLLEAELMLANYMPGYKMEGLKDAIDLHTKIVNRQIVFENDELTIKVFKIARRLINLYYNTQ